MVLPQYSRAVSPLPFKSLLCDGVRRGSSGSKLTAIVLRLIFGERLPLATATCNNLEMMDAAPIGIESGAISTLIRALQDYDPFPL